MMSSAAMKIPNEVMASYHSSYVRRLDWEGILDTSAKHRIFFFLRWAINLMLKRELKDADLRSARSQKSTAACRTRTLICPPRCNNVT